MPSYTQRSANLVSATADKLSATRTRARTGQRVRRDSRHQGEQELRQWRTSNTFSRSENNAWMRAAEAFDRETKKPGKRNGAIGHLGLEVLRFMLRLRGKADGRLDPSYAWLAGQLRRSRSAVIAAVARLRRNGFLSWMRRTRPVDDPEPGGQYVEQISNAYFLSLARRTAEAVERMTRAAREATQRAVTAIERTAREARASVAPAPVDASTMPASRLLPACPEQVKCAVRQDQASGTPPLRGIALAPHAAHRLLVLAHRPYCDPIGSRFRSSLTQDRNSSCRSIGPSWNA